MSVSIRWKDDSNTSRSMYFADLQEGTCYKISTSHARGAVYMKIYDVVNHEYKALELATGKVFPSQTSPVEVVKVSVQIDSEKPSIY